jgi:phenylalanyl-tRNA synthetase alpha chain
MQEKLEKLRDKIINEIGAAADSRSLRDLEIKYLGRKGELTIALRSIAALSAAEKKTIGRLANDIKQAVQTAISQAHESLEQGGSRGEVMDATMPVLPKDRIRHGHLHPISQVLNELEELFSSMGFMVLDGPELESDYFNFAALNIPYYHPARDIQDTFYIDHKSKSGEYDLVLRTQTSPMQIRAMLKYGAPLRCVVPGRVFRNEATDAVHESTFYQLEGLMIDREISTANLISVMKEMLNGIFRHSVEIRVRPGYFPFTEPSLEVDIKCLICGGTGCPSCKHSGWLEMIGSGLIHPKVLEYGGIDPKKFSGFAFGLGVTRLAMMKYGISDIRLFNSGDLRFLNQF